MDLTTPVDNTCTKYTPTNTITLCKEAVPFIMIHNARGTSNTPPDSRVNTSISDSNSDLSTQIKQVDPTAGSG